MDRAVVPEPNEIGIKSDLVMRIDNSAGTKYYVYLLEFDDGTVYIGKGQGRRWLAHKEFERYTAYILYFFEYAAQAFRYEAELIKHFYCRARNKIGNNCYGEEDWLRRPFRDNQESDNFIRSVMRQEWDR